MQSSFYRENKYNNFAILIKFYVKKKYQHWQLTFVNFNQVTLHRILTILGSVFFKYRRLFFEYRKCAFCVQTNTSENGSMLQTYSN